MNLLEGSNRGATARRFDSDVSEMVAGVRLAERREESSVRLQVYDMRLQKFVESMLAIGVADSAFSPPGMESCMASKFSRLM
jgi:hypothetical protein